MPRSCKCILDRAVFKGAMSEEDRDKILRNLKGAELPTNTDLEDVKPVGKYTAVGTKYDFVTTNRGAQRTSDIVLKILERLYNDFTMRRDEERALDWAMNFIREHRKEGE